MNYVLGCENIWKRRRRWRSPSFLLRCRFSSPFSLSLPLLSWSSSSPFSRIDTLIFHSTRCSANIARSIVVLPGVKNTRKNKLLFSLAFLFLGAFLWCSNKHSACTTRKDLFLCLSRPLALSLSLSLSPSLSFYSIGTLIIITPTDISFSRGNV